jgi:hypothetical protein
VRGRDAIPQAERRQFCVFVDEVQNFAGKADLGVLIEQARKYVVATTIAHQNRAGQLADNKAMLGAAASAANKVCFQLIVKDAEELAPEFAIAASEISQENNPARDYLCLWAPRRNRVATTAKAIIASAVAIWAWVNISAKLFIF